MDSEQVSGRTGARANGPGFHKCQGKERETCEDILGFQTDTAICLSYFPGREKLEILQ